MRITQTLVAAWGRQFTKKDFAEMKKLSIELCGVCPRQGYRVRFSNEEAQFFSKEQILALLR